MRARAVLAAAVLALSGLTPVAGADTGPAATPSLSAKLGADRTACLLERVGVPDRSRPSVLRKLECGTGAGAADTPARLEPLSQCVTAQDVNDVCERWGKRFSDPTSYTTFQRDVPVGVVASPKGDRLYVAGTTLIDAGGKMAVAAFDSANGNTRWVAHPAGTLPTIATAMALSPDGSKIFVTGIVILRPDLQSFPFAYFYTVAFSTKNGKQLWAVRYTGIGGNNNIPTAMTVSPRGDRLYVTGYSDRPGPFQVIPQDWATVALKTSNGKSVWVGRYSGAAGGINRSFDVAVSPRGDRVYMTGFSERPTTSPFQQFDYATAAYKASNGRGLWVTRYKSEDVASAVGMAVGRDDTVYVTGFAQYKATGTVYDYATVAYRGANGKSKWVARYRGVPGGTNIPSAITVSPRGDRVFVTGQSDQRFSTVPGTVPDVYLPTFATVGYSSGGKKLWASRYTPQNAPALATTLTVDPSGRKLFVAGAYGSANGLFNVTYIATLGYDAAKGGQQWVARYDVRDPANPGSNFPVGVVTNPKGTVVYEVSTLSPAPDAARGTACSTVSRCKADAGDLLLLSYPA